MVRFEARLRRTPPSGLNERDGRYTMTSNTATKKNIGDFSDALLALDRTAAQGILSGASSEIGAIPAIEAIVIPALEDMGERFEKGEIAISQIYMSGRICEEVVDRILPGESEAQISGGHPQIALAVLDDHHGLGKKIVSLTLRSAGYGVIDYGVGVQVDDLVEKILNDKIRIMIISVLMLPSALKVKEVADRLSAAAGPGKVRLIVGGSPFRFDPHLWREVGADAMGHNAAEVIDEVSSMISRKDG